MATTISYCEAHRDFIETQLSLKRNAMAIYQELVDQRGFVGKYNSVKRFCAMLRVVDSCVRVEHYSSVAYLAPIDCKVLVRVFNHRIEIRDLKTQALLRTHTKAEHPGSVMLPKEERIFNPSRQTHFLLSQARAIGPQTDRLCQMLFAIEGRRVGQRKLWCIVGLAKQYTRRLIDSTCARAIEDGVHSCMIP